MRPPERRKELPPRATAPDPFKPVGAIDAHSRPCSFYAALRGLRWNSTYQGPIACTACERRDGAASPVTLRRLAVGAGGLPSDRGFRALCLRGQPRGGFRASGAVPGNAGDPLLDDSHHRANLDRSALGGSHTHTRCPATYHLPLRRGVPRCLGTRPARRALGTHLGQKQAGPGTRTAQRSR